ncbi:MAG: pseudouridine synthase [Bacillota bacterium]
MKQPPRARSSRSEVQGDAQGRNPALRLSRFMAGAGVASRRHADELIEQGRVTVNGEKAVLGQRVVPGIDRIAVDGREVGAKEQPVYVLLNKPPGYLSTCSDPFDRRTVLSLISGVKARVFPVGRLDLDAEGLLLLTNDGDLAYLLTHPKHHVVKEYLVEVAGDGVQEKTKAIRSGIIVEGKKVEVDYVRFLRSRQADEGRKPRQGPASRPAVAPPGPAERRSRVLIAVHEGEKHLVKNLCRAVGLQVKRLQRVKMGPLRLGDLPHGKWRYLEDKEVAALYADARRKREGEQDGQR